MPHLADMEEVYTKLEYTSDMAHCTELRHEALHLVSEARLDGFLFLETERAIARAEESCKKRWARSQALLGALRVNKIKLEKAWEPEEIDRLSKRVRYLKMLAGKILAGTERLQTEPQLNGPGKWPWVRMINGWQRVVEED